MSPGQIVTLIIAIVIVAAGAILVILQNRRKKLQTRFGPEYDRTVLATGSKLKADAELQKRQDRVEKYAIHPLTPVDRDRFQQSWRGIQAAFVDDPGRAFTEADRLVGEVMSLRGYPVVDFAQRAAEISVDHPAVVENYRIAHEIAVRHLSGGATTEELRQGMIHYRALFNDLTGEPEPLAARAAASRS